MISMARMSDDPIPASVAPRYAHRHRHPRGDRDERFSPFTTIDIPNIPEPFFSGEGIPSLRRRVHANTHHRIHHILRIIPRWRGCPRPLLHAAPRERARRRSLHRFRSGEYRWAHGGPWIGIGRYRGHPNGAVYRIIIRLSAARQRSHT